MKIPSRSFASHARRLLAAGVAFICLTGFSSTAAAYRTAGELPDFEGTEKVAWASSDVGFVLNEDIPSGLGGIEISSGVVRSAIETWNAPTCTSVWSNLKGISPEAAAPGDGQNTIQWVRFDWEAQGYPADSAAFTDTQYAKIDGAWRIVEADIYLNAATQQWVLSGSGDGTTRDLHSVLVHETGHALGLMHPCEPGGGADGALDCGADESFQQTTMYPLYSDTQSELSQDDIDGICWLYPGPRCQITGCGEGFECTDAGCVETCGEALCAVGELCVDGECVDPTSCIDASCFACEGDSDCAEPLQCIDGTCRLGEALAGDPCGGPGACSTGLCSDEGYCQATCSENWECGAEGACDIQSGACTVDDRLPLGATCSSPTECLGGECLTDLTDEPVCTRPCGKDLPRCPGDWSCETADGESVCHPPQEASGCSCRVAPGLPDPGTSLAFSASVLSGLLVALFRISRRHARAHHS
jgi:hypothetical protein